MYQKITKLLIRGLSPRIKNSLLNGSIEEQHAIRALFRDFYEGDDCKNLHNLYLGGHGLFPNGVISGFESDMMGMSFLFSYEGTREYPPDFFYDSDVTKWVFVENVKRVFDCMFCKEHSHWVVTFKCFPLYDGAEWTVITFHKNGPEFDSEPAGSRPTEVSDGF